MDKFKIDLVSPITAGSSGIFISADCTGFFHNVYKFNRSYSELRLPKDCMLMLKNDDQDFLEVGMAPKTDMNHTYFVDASDKIAVADNAFDDSSKVVNQHWTIVGAVNSKVITNLPTSLPGAKRIQAEGPSVEIQLCDFLGKNPDGSDYFEYEDAAPGFKRLKSIKLIGLVCRPKVAPAFDEAQERALFEMWADRHFAAADFRRMGNDLYLKEWMRNAYAGYLACARLKAGVTGHE